jgi:hypothetical protein
MIDRRHDGMNIILLSPSPKANRLAKKSKYSNNSSPSVPLKESTQSLNRYQNFSD